jgi:hypothetical protein
VAALASSFFVAALARGASVADTVREHVDKNLESEDRAPPPKPHAEHPPPRKPPARRPAEAPPPAPEASTETPPPAAPPANQGPSYPIRVIGKNLRLDPKLGGGYRGWILQQYPSVSVAAQSYFTWSIEAQAKLFGLITVHRGYFESNGLSSPRTSGAVIATQVGAQESKAAWLLGMLGVPITDAWEPIIRYETRAFLTTAAPSRPVRILPHDTPANTDLASIPATTDRLRIVSGFETFVAGVRYNHVKNASATLDSNAPPLPPFYFGLGLIQYSKPYQVTVGDAVLDSVLFDARFRGAGIAGGFEFPSRPDSLILNAAMQLGLGEVRLLDDLTLNELLPKAKDRGALTPPEWLIGYLQGDVTVGYVYTLLRTAPSVMVSAALTGGGATFFYFKTQTEQGHAVSAPPLNWDFLWGVRADVTVPL